MKNIAIIYFLIWFTVVSPKTVLSASSKEEIYHEAIAEGKNILTLPLITHHVLKKRRLDESGLTSKEHDTVFPSPPPRKHYQKSRRTSQEVGGLYQGYGTHYVDLWVGTPPQRQTVIVDTGSGVTAFPCSGCKDCGSNYHADPFFVEADSSSFEKMNCQTCYNRANCQHENQSNEMCKLSVSYQEGSSWVAYQARDLTYLGGPHNNALDIDTSKARKHVDSILFGEDPLDASSFRFPLTFGCQTKITGLFKTQLADGIMGMSIRDGSLWQQMYDHGAISDRRFSLCFTKEDNVEKDGTVAGALTMGGTDTNLHQTPMVFSKGFVSGSNMHGVTIRKLYFMKAGEYRAVNATVANTVALNVAPDLLNKGNVIVDSGTTDTYLVRHVANEFKKVFKELVGKDYVDVGMKLTKKEFSRIPSLVIQLNGYLDVEQEFDPSNPSVSPGLAGKLDPDNPNDILVVMPPSHFIEYHSGRERYVPRLYIDERYGSVLGANFMAGHDILFDIPVNDRIGFAESDCNYNRFIDPYVSSVSTLSPTATVSEELDQ